MVPVTYGEKEGHGSDGTDGSEGVHPSYIEGRGGPFNGSCVPRYSHKPDYSRIIKDIPGKHVRRARKSRMDG